MSFEKHIQKKKKPKKARITDLMDNKVKVVKGQFILMKSKKFEFDMNEGKCSGTGGNVCVCVRACMYVYLWNKILKEKALG